MRPRIRPGLAAKLIRRNTEGLAAIAPLSAAGGGRAIDRMGSLGASGGVVSDALIARAAEKAGADRFLTLNLGDFERARPEGRAIPAAP